MQTNISWHILAFCPSLVFVEQLSNGEDIAVEPHTMLQHNRLASGFRMMQVKEMSNTGTQSRKRGQGLCCVEEMVVACVFVYTRTLSCDSRLASELSCTMLNIHKAVLVGWGGMDIVRCVNEICVRWVVCPFVHIQSVEVLILDQHAETREADRVPLAEALEGVCPPMYGAHLRRRALRRY